MRRFLLGAAAFLGIGLGLPLAGRPIDAIAMPERRGRMNVRRGDHHNPMGTTPNRGLRRIQGRQARK